MTKEETAGVAIQICGMLANNECHWDEAYLQMVLHNAEARYKRDQARYLAYAMHREAVPATTATEVYAR